MDNTRKSFYIYCDESRVENEDSNKMVIGSLLIPSEGKEKIVKNIKGIYKKYNFNYELKWAKTSNRYFEFYNEIIDYFQKEDLLNFRVIIVDKSQIDYGVYHDNDKELAFFKFYYLLLRQQLNSFNNYYIFLDKKPTRDKNRARALESFLDSYVLIHKNQCSIKHLQAYSSKENILLQLTDFITGLVGYINNSPIEGTTKYKVALSAQEKLKSKLNSTTPLSNHKFNILVWEHDR